MAKFKRYRSYDSGTYVLLLECLKDTTIGVGSLGGILFKKGFYAYVGSARNGVNTRIKRHYKKKKKLKWHIDYVTVNDSFKIIGYLFFGYYIESAVSNILCDFLEPIPRFGCSDTKDISHLFFASSLDEIFRVISFAFEHLITS